MKQEKVFQYIIAQLENGTVPWKCPYIPMTSGNGHVYRGINKLVLNLRAREMKYKSPFWYTYLNCKKNGGQVRKGQKGVHVVYFAQGKYTDEKTDKEKGYSTMKVYSVFNQEQCDFHEDYVEPELVDEYTPASALCADYIYREKIEQTNSPGMAFYNPKSDKINIPAMSALSDESHYYPTLFHEMGHSTGHEGRLNRKGVASMSLFDDHQYSEEELVAEMTAAYLCGATDREMKDLDQSAAYIESWLKVFGGDKSMLQRAATQAEKACEFIMGKQDAVL